MVEHAQLRQTAHVGDKLLLLKFGLTQRAELQLGFLLRQLLSLGSISSLKCSTSTPRNEEVGSELTVFSNSPKPGVNTGVCAHCAAKMGSGGASSEPVLLVDTSSWKRS